MSEVIYHYIKMYYPDLEINSCVVKYILANFSEIADDVNQAFLLSQSNNKHQNDLDCFMRNWLDMQLTYSFEVFQRLPHANKIKIKGDYHNKQRATCEVDFDRGEVCIYKPRSATALSFFNKIYTLLSKQFDFQPIKVIREWENAFLCEKVLVNNEMKKDMQKFSFHYGAICLLAQVFRITDLHVDNVLNINSIPMIIDMETMFYPKIAALPNFTFSGTLLLPGRFNKRAPCGDLSSLCVESLRQGARVAAKMLKENESALFELMTTHNQFIHTRIIFKPTPFYLQLIKNSLHGNLLSNAYDRSIYIQKCLQGKHDISKQIQHYELSSIIDCDVPYFYIKNHRIYDGYHNELALDVSMLTCAEIIESIEISLDAVLNALHQVVECIK